MMMMTTLIEQVDAEAGEQGRLDPRSLPASYWKNLGNKERREGPGRQLRELALFEQDFPSSW